MKATSAIITEYKEARDKLVKVVESLKGSNEDIAGTWDLKNVIAHLTGWAEYQISVLEDIIHNKLPQKWGDIDIFNKKSVSKRVNYSLDKVINEYLQVTDKLIESYGKIPAEIWDKPIWKDLKATPTKLLNIEIRHILKTHLPQMLEHVGSR